VVFYSIFNSYQAICLAHPQKIPSAKQSLIYREIQVLSTLNNCINKTVVLIMTLAGITFSAISLTVLVKLKWTKDNLFTLSYFTLLLCDTVPFLLVCVGGMVGSYVASKNVIAAFTSRILNQPPNITARHCHRWFGRYVKSLLPIKIKIGDNNFLEELTALKCVDVALNLAINVLLVRVG